MIWHEDIVKAAGKEIDPCGPFDLGIRENEWRMQKPFEAWLRMQLSEESRKEVVKRALAQSLLCLKPKQRFHTDEEYFRFASRAQEGEDGALRVVLSKLYPALSIYFEHKQCNFDNVKNMWASQWMWEIVLPVVFFWIFQKILKPEGQTSQVLEWSEARFIKWARKSGYQTCIELTPEQIQLLGMRR